MSEILKSFISVKFDAVGRRHQFLLPEVGFDPPLAVGDDVVVATGTGATMGPCHPRSVHSMPGGPRPIGPRGR